MNSMVRFALVGVANTALGYSVTLGLHYGLGVPPLVANALGYIAGMLLSYTLHRSFTFNSDRPHAQAMPRFFATAGACFLLNLLVLYLALQLPGMPVAVAQAMAMVSYTAAFYVISRVFVFRKGNG